MNRWIVLALLVVGGFGGVGCSREPKAPARPSGGREERAPQAGTQAGGVGGAEGEFVLTKEKLDGYLRYQKALINIYDSLLKEMEKLPARPDSGRPGAAANAAMRVLEGKARAEEQARAEANLTERDTREIERMAMAIINRRTMARSFDPTAAIKQWESMRDALPPDQRAELDKSISDLKAQQEEATKLTEERKQFGDANVDVILTREDELTASYNAYVARLTGHR